MIFCERAFTAKDSLNKHITIYDKVKLLKCKICGRDFSFPCDMKQEFIKGKNYSLIEVGFGGHVGKINCMNYLYSNLVRKLNIMHFL